ncbi:NAD(P)H-binding protein [Longispora albida]|uniref:NAD(P)H-binding protein n=1 Tax=Longispora albida TaxID=203523 RepID=UPI00037B5339|nr:NAD(P)H-binding protein [Longispora albida]
MLLITGANGQFGRRVVHHLLHRVPAERVAVSVRNPAEAAELAELGVDVRRGDFDEPGSLPFAGVDRMLLVSTTALPHSERYRQHASAVTAAAEAGVKHLVYTSLALGLPPCISEVHRKTEDAILAAGLPYTFLRHPLYTDNFLTGITADPDLVSATGDGRVATASRDDLAEAAAQVLASPGPEHEGRAYDLTGAEAWNFAELAGLLTAGTGTPFQHRPVSGTELASLLAAEGVPDFLNAILVDIHTTMAAGTLAGTTPHLADLLGRAPVTLAAAVQAELARAGKSDAVGGNG